MDVRAIRVALLLLGLPIAGCGTVANLANQKPGAGGVSPFGGVRQDVCCLQQAANGEVGVRTRHKSESEQYPRAALMMFCAADLPLSLIGDLVTWPYTVSYTFINQPVPTPPVVLTPPPPPQAVYTPPTTQPMSIPTAPGMQAPLSIPPPSGMQLPPAEARPQPAPPYPLPKLP
jgi:uncharacterized protein YceK